MIGLRAGSVLAALLLVASCGKSKEEERMEAFKANCLALTGQTVGAAVSTFSLNPGVLCLDPNPPHLAGSTCPYGTSQFICRGFFSSYSNDPGLCGPPPIGGCWYFCEFHFPGNYGDTIVTSDTVICGERFVSGQPYPP